MRFSRARAYTAAGADAVMIHSRKREPDEVFEFAEKFRAFDSSTPLVVVPTSYSSVTEEELRDRGVNVVIYANQLTRAEDPRNADCGKTYTRKSPRQGM